MAWRLLAGRVDVGEAGTRAGSLVLPVLAVSLAMCLLELPQSRIGLVLNGVLVPLLLLHPPPRPGMMRWQLTGDNVRARPDASAHGLAGTFTSASVDSMILAPLSLPAFDVHVYPFRTPVHEIEAGETVRRLPDDGGN